MNQQSAPASRIQPGYLGPVLTLAQREVTRFFRQPSRVLAALGTPLLFWLVLGSGMGRSFHSLDGASDEHFLRYFFPGIILLTLMFAAIFSTISIIEDRSAGFLQGVLASPTPRGALVLGKILGGTALALIQGGALFVLAPWAGFHPGPGGWLLALGYLALTAFVMTGLGFLIAWRMDSIQGFHAVMNLLLMPMWMLSGAVFPSSGAEGWIRALMTANPLVYGLQGLRDALEGAPGRSLPLFVLGLSGLIVFTASAFSARGKQG